MKGTQEGKAPGQGRKDQDALVGARRDMMRVLAHAEPAEIEAVLGTVDPLPEHSDLRKPEVGLVMLRGRIGGDGAAFNVGEATVTRAVVRIAGGEIGFSYVLGREPQKARLAALIDALWQGPDRPRVAK